MTKLYVYKQAKTESLLLRVYLFIIFSFFNCSLLFAQSSSNFVNKRFQINKDTTQIDSLSIIPASEIVRINGKIISDSSYQIDYASSLFIVPKRFIGETISISYRHFPLNFSKDYYHKGKDQIEQTDAGTYDFFTLKDKKEDFDIFSVSGLKKNGSISRGLNFGNSQDLSVNSDLDLQLSGQISDKIGIMAAISDNNLPIQAEGNTQQLQEFDRVFIKLFTDNTSLIAGDFKIERPKSYFMNLNKKVQGAGFSTKITGKKELTEVNKGTLETSVNAAISKGKFSRNVIQGVEGNQGPYLLKGAENESFIIVLSGTEKVYINGKLLKRGEDYDYIIDYNTAELRFTVRQMINKDMRIVVEFQYAERSYSRSLIFSENQYKKDKLRLNFNLYSEQDQKNQPLQQDLSNQEKAILKTAGDDLSKAVVSGIDSSGFINDQVMYKLIDTLGYSNVLVYSKNLDSALYRAKFSRIKHGNYIQVRSDANGRVFQWVAPKAGVPQGNYEAVIQLVTPKKKQLVTLGAAYDFSKNTNLGIETAFSNNDINTFSDKDAGDDESYGVQLKFEHRQPLGKNDSAVENPYWNSALFLEQRGKDFEYIERYRDVEFERNWNTQGLLLAGDERIIRAKTGFSKNRNFFNYELGNYTKGNDYKGIKNGYSTQFKKGGFSIISNGSYLTTQSFNKTEFLRHYTTITQKIWGLKVGGYLEQEKNLFHPKENDSLLSNSLNQITWRSFIQKGDSTENQLYRLSYGETYDYLPNGTKLNYGLKSKNFDFDFLMGKNPKSRLSGKIGYRKLSIFKEELTTQQPEENILGRLEYNLKALKGFISSTTFYEIGSGLENRREFSYLKVSDGQGTHFWQDYNKNGVKELNEFEIAGVNHQYQANYIKVYTPTNSFVRVYNNQFNQLLFIRPMALLNGKSGVLKFLGKFSDKATYRAERKTQESENIYNPLYNNINDSGLVSINSTFSNNLYFNRLNPKFGTEYNYLNNKSKTLITNGFESRNLIKHELNSRYNISRVFSLENKLSYGETENLSEYFINRRFNILDREISPKVNYQPSVRFRLSVYGIYAEKSNTMGEEESYNRTAALEIQYNQLSKGSFSLELRYINIDFNSSSNSALAFEMLEGLTPGGNTTWNVIWQRKLSNGLQLNLTYGGRKSADLKVIHTGGMQLRAYF